MFIKLFIRVDLNFCSPNWNLWSTNDVQHRLNLIEVEIVIQWCFVSVNSAKVKCDYAKLKMEMHRRNKVGFLEQKLSRSKSRYRFP